MNYYFVFVVALLLHVETFGQKKGKQKVEHGIQAGAFYYNSPAFELSYYKHLSWPETKNGLWMSTGLEYVKTKPEKHRLILQYSINYDVIRFNRKFGITLMTGFLPVLKKGNALDLIRDTDKFLNAFRTVGKAGCMMVYKQLRIGYRYNLAFGQNFNLAPELGFPKHGISLHYSLKL